MAETKKNKDTNINKTATKTTVKTKRAKVELNAMIPCRSIVKGGLNFVSKKTGNQYYWSEYGEVVEVEMEDLLQMKQHDRKILFEPWMIVEDDDAVSHLGIESVYKNIIPIDNIIEIYEYPVDKLREVLTKAPNGMKKVIAETTRELMSSGKIDLTQGRIKAIEETLNVDLIP